MKQSLNESLDFAFFLAALMDLGEVFEVVAEERLFLGELLLHFFNCLFLDFQKALDFLLNRFEVFSIDIQLLLVVFSTLHAPGEDLLYEFQLKENLRRFLLVDHLSEVELLHGLLEVVEIVHSIRF